MSSFLFYSIFVSVTLLTVAEKSSIFISGVILGIVSLPEGFGYAVSDRIYKMKRKRPIIIGATILSTMVAFIVALFAGQDILAITLLLVSSCALAIGYVALFGFVLENDKRDVGEFSAFNIIGGGVGGAIGAILSGHTAGSAGISTAMLAFIGISVVFIIYFYSLCGEKSGFA
jgi:predicted MFS family arabinose efflux permease